MSCSSCSTGKDGKAAGCRGNGTCDTGGCNKLNVYNWLAEMALPAGQKPFDVLEVRFKGSRKEFFRNKDLIDLKGGDIVAVESSPGHDVGVVSMTGELVRLQLRKKNISESSDTIRAIYRKAKPNEVEKWYEVKDKESATLHRTREIIQMLKLNMKLSDVEFQGDGKKITFFYTADDRVDFRELIKKLADEFHVRVEMRQIGMRQEASRLGGIGVCGLELCCSTWLTDFKTVTTNTARYQNLALNPAKLAGQCGKLKCCLNYELDSYMDALRDFPATTIVLETEKGRASHKKTDIFKRLMWYGYGGDDRREQTESTESVGVGEGGNWIPIRVDRAKEIIELNKQSIKPPDLRGKEVEEEEEDVIPDYANVVGQDRIDRMDKKKKKKKKKKKPSGVAGDQRQASQQPGQKPGGSATPEGSTPKPGGQPNQRQDQPRNPRPPQGQQPRPQQQGQGQQQRQQQPRPQQQGQQQRPQQGQQQQPPPPKPDQQQAPPGEQSTTPNPARPPRQDSKNKNP